MFKERISARLGILMALSFIACNADAQFYVGITGDIGNRVKSSPSPPSAFFKHPAAISGSVMLIGNIPLQHSWQLQFGGAAGVMGYIVKAAPYDSIPKPLINHSYATFRNYNTFYFDGWASFGRKFKVYKTRYAQVSVGGGLTYYNNTYNAGWIQKPFTWENLFKYEMDGEDWICRGFVDLSCQTNLNRWLVLGLRYRHHFSRVVEGNYSYQQANSSGQLSVTQRAFGVFLMAKIFGDKSS